MSRLPTIVPWKSNKDISELKELFYGNSNDGAEYDPRIKALAKVKAYQTRAANIPHSIESTSLLTAAIVNDIPNNDQFNIRMSYSMAIIRFVNGLLDPSQQSQYALPLHLLAKSLDLPSAFVELRHAATHEALPSLETLRQMTRRALDWLWRHYWNHNSYDQESTGELNNKTDQIKELMREWRRIRRTDPIKVMKIGDNSEEGTKFWKLIRKIESVIEQDEELFIEVLLYKNVLIPNGTDGLKKLTSSIKLFGPLFEYIKVDGFMHRLTLTCINLLNNQKTILDWTPTAEANIEEADQESPQFYPSLVEWIKYFLVKKRLNNFLLADVDNIIKELLTHPREWNVHILENYLEKLSTIKGSSNTSFNQGKLRVLLEQTTSQLETINAIRITPQEPISNSEKQRKRVRDTEEQVDKFTKRLKSEKEKHHTGNVSANNEQIGWPTVPNWTARPIGVL